MKRYINNYIPSKAKQKHIDKLNIFIKNIPTYIILALFCFFLLMASQYDREIYAIEREQIEEHTNYFAK